MSADPGPPVPDRRLLSESLRSSLREAFVSEVTERLPRLQALATGADVDLDQVCRDAHTLGSSAWVVELPETSAAAREVEALLQRLLAGEPADLGGPLAVLLELLEDRR